MRKRMLLPFLLLALLLPIFASCAEKTPKNTKNSLEPEEVSCLHEWALADFVTEETTIPFAGKYVCKKCEESKIDSFDYADIEIPLVNIEGDISEISKENKVGVRLSYADEALSFESDATIKWQGMSSLHWEKKNFSVTLREIDSEKKRKVVVKESWGAESKYCLKSNYTDPSGLRNIVLSDLYGEIARTRESDDPFSTLVNGGAVDGFPVLLYLNGQYQGLYNWNIPKDKWLFSMGDEDGPEAVLCGTDYPFERSGEIEIRENDKRYWEVEYYNENYGDGTYAWAVDSFNKLLSFVKNSDSARLRAEASDWLNSDRTLDVLLFSFLFGARDNIHNNLVWCTYDGKTWAPVPYDLDLTLGRCGAELYGPEKFSDFEGNPLYGNLFKAFYPELRERYFELRRSLLTTQTILELFLAKGSGVDERFFRSEAQKWRNASWWSSDAIVGSFEEERAFIRDYLDRRFANCDALFSNESFAL